MQQPSKKPREKLHNLCVKNKWNNLFIFITMVCLSASLLLPSFHSWHLQFVCSQSESKTERHPDKLACQQLVQAAESCKQQERWGRQSKMETDAAIPHLPGLIDMNKCYAISSKINSRAVKQFVRLGIVLYVLWKWHKCEYISARHSYLHCYKTLLTTVCSLTYLRCLLQLAVR